MTKADDKLQAQRFELKFRIPKSQAPGIRDFVSSYLVPDEYSVGKPEYSYANHSVYLDSDDLRLYWDVINGNKNRFKLRVRYYDDDPATPVFFEIKRRSNDAILKQRGPVRREAVSPLLSGHLPEPGFLLSSKPQHLAALHQFCRLMSDLRAVPKVQVSYLREAWVSESDNSVRVTLDRDVCAVAHTTHDITTRLENPVMAFEPDVILEIKFTGRFPTWIREMVRIFGVMQSGSAKYVESAVLLGEERLNPEWLPYDRRDLIEKFLTRNRRNGAEGSPDPLASDLFYGRTPEQLL